MTNKHTPGPWEAEFCTHPEEDLGKWLVAHPKTECDVTVVCAVDGVGLNNEANARLIAAAPDLLAALQLIIEEPRRSTDGDNGFWGIAMAAVEKAKGSNNAA